jgi:thioredoxin 1
MANIFTEKNFEQEVLKASGVVLVDLFATWCAPCKMLSPVIDKISNQYEGKIKVGKIDIDENMGLAQKYGVQSIPTLLFFKDGKVEHSLLGVQTQESIENILNNLR